MEAWQTCACDPATGPACTGLLRGVVIMSCERRTHFSGVPEPTDVGIAGGGAQDPSAVLQPASAESCEDFNNHAG